MIENYKELINQIEIHTEILNNVEYDIENLVELIHSSAPREMKGLKIDGMPKGSRNDMTLDRIYDLIRKLESMKFIEESIIENKKATIAEIDKKLEESSSSESQVYYWRFIKNKTQEETAEIIDRSTRQVQRIEEKLRNNKNVV